MTIASSRGPIVKTNEELINAIKQGKADPTVISNFRERFMGACDGRSTERIADYIMSQKQRILIYVGVNSVRPLTAETLSAYHNDLFVRYIIII